LAIKWRSAHIIHIIVHCLVLATGQVKYCKVQEIQLTLRQLVVLPMKRMKVTCSGDVSDLFHTLVAFHQIQSDAVLMNSGNIGVSSFPSLCFAAKVQQTWGEAGRQTTEE